MPPPPFVCGDRVHVHFSDDQCWYKGVVSDMVKEPGEDEISYSITYDDGSSESGVKAQDMRMQGRPGNRVLATLDAAGVAARVAAIGPGFSQFAAAIEELACDGAFLASLSPAELDETFEDIGVTARLQRRRVAFALGLGK